MIGSQAIFETAGIAAGVLMGFALAALLGVAQANERGEIGAHAAPQDIEGGLETAIDTGDRLNAPVSVEESGTTLSLRPEEGELVLEFEEVTRHRVAQYLLAKSGTAIHWANRAHATELISGRYSGSLQEIILRLLSRSNYVIAYDTSGGEQRIARVLVLGPVRSQRQAPAGVRAVVTAEGQLRDQEQQVLQRLEAAREAAERLRESRGR